MAWLVDPAVVLPSKALLSPLLKPQPFSLVTLSEKLNEGRAATLCLRFHGKLEKPHEPPHLMPDDEPPPDPSKTEIPLARLASQEKFRVRQMQQRAVFEPS